MAEEAEIAEAGVALDKGFQIAGAHWAVIVGGLAAANALLLSIAFAFLIVGSLLGKELAQDGRLATVPITAYVAAAAVIVLPAGMLMQLHGRRVLFIAAGIAGSGELL